MRRNTGMPSRISFSPIVVAGMAARAWPPGALPISFEVEWVANSPYAMALACFPRAPARLLAAVKHARAAGSEGTAASDEAARRPSVMRQADVDHGLPSVLTVTLTSRSSPVCFFGVCAGLPQPRSRRMAVAATRVASVSPLRMMAASERTASPV